MWSTKRHGFLLINFLVLFAICTSAPSKKKEEAKLPSFVKPCHRSDPEISTCVRNVINSLKSRIPYGIPELFIPAIEPLVIPEIKMDQDSGAVYMHSTYKDVKIHGLSNYTLADILVDASRPKIVMTMTFPNVTLKAKYVMKGKIMMMPLMGNGDCEANFTDVTINTVINTDRYKRNGLVYVKVKDIKTKYTLGKSQVRLENLFNGDSALGERMNTFINENWDTLSDELRPLMENAMSEIVRASADRLFKTYSFDQLMPA